MKIARKLIPYEHAGVSPFERPLTDLEIKKYAENFSDCKVRSFSLPFVNLLEILNLSALYNNAIKLDRTILDKMPLLEHYASIKVFEMSK